MSTNSTIVVKVKPEDIGKVMKYNVLKLPKGKQYTDAFLDNIKEVKLGAYIEAYHHWDGYPDGIGKELLKNYTDYDTALNLLLGGSMSTCIGDCVTHHASWRNEDWDGVKPLMYDDVPKCDEQYMYLFEDGIWKVTTQRLYPEFVLVSDSIDK